MRTTEIAVIGAGVVGAACAYYLTREGWRVTLFDSGGIAAGTSSACTGIVGYGLYGDDQELQLRKAAMAEFDGLIEQGFDLDHSRPGALAVPVDDQAEAILRERAEMVRGSGFTPEWIEGEALQDAEPSLSTSYRSALLLPELAQVSPMRLAVELTQAAGRLGCRVVTGTAVTGLDAGDGAVRGLRTTQETIAADAVVLAAGIWSREIAALAGIDLPIRPVRGHVAATEPTPGVVHHIVVSFGEVHDEDAGPSDQAPLGRPPPIMWNVEELSTGTLLLGGSREEGGYDRRVDPGVMRRILSGIVQLIPRISEIRLLRSFVGLRPTSPDGRPIVAMSATLGGLAFATGHGGEGITLSLLTGRRVAELFHGDQPADIGPWSAERFGL